MYFRHVPEIWERFPQLVPGLLVIEGVGPAAGGEDYLQRWYERARRRVADRSESEMPEVAAWRRVYAQMGLKPTRYRSASEALLRRFKREGELPRLHPLVDVCNAASLAYALPVAAFDLVKIQEFLEVRPAVGTEQYLSFQGEIEHPEPGEIIFADAVGHAHARRWTFRQSGHSAVEAGTERVLIVSEGVHDGARRDVEALLAELWQAIASLWREPVMRTVLTAERPRVEFAP